MARAFTKNEREAIETLLLEKAKELFLQYGYQKTSIAQITEAVGIAQGSFYLFFRSKEALYFRLLEKEETYFQNLLLNFNFNEKDSPKSALKQVFQIVLKELENNRLMKDLIHQDQLFRLRQRLSHGTLEKHFLRDTTVFQKILTTWEKQGLRLNITPEVFVAVFRTLFIVILQKEIIGENVFKSTLDLLLTSIVNEIIDS